MNIKCLDLDDPLTYEGIFDEIIYADVVWPDLNRYFQDPPGKIWELFGDPTEMKDPFLQKVQNACEKLFREKYDFVVGYHACRTNDPEAYRRLGLLTASQERLEANARKIFAGMDGLDEAIAQARSYFKPYEGQVHMYISARFASIEYLEGSYYFKAVAAHFRGGEKHLEKQGKPYFVKCKLPLSWLNISSPYWGELRFLYRYVAAIMQRCIWAKAHQDEECEIRGTLAVLRDIPSESVLSVLDADVCQEWERRKPKE